MDVSSAGAYQNAGRQLLLHTKSPEASSACASAFAALQSFVRSAACPVRPWRRLASLQGCHFSERGQSKGAPIHCVPEGRSDKICYLEHVGPVQMVCP
mmetsp:Transcript_57835/g.161435  ORF Transcript_57835/g.161435 Transcript_57835/m.161435 type:complete len:98 (-) Transcript_57835:1292-1585(-)